MKKQIIVIYVVSLLQFQLAASDHDRREEFIRSHITQEYINHHYEDFFKYTEKQVKLLHAFSPRSKMIATMAGWWYGYDDSSKRLLGIGELVLDENWRKRLEGLRACSEEDLAYFNNAKQYVPEHMTAKYNTKDALNQFMYYTHEFHVEELQKRECFTDEFLQKLKKNSQKMNGEYPMYHYLSEYKETHNGELPQTVVLNMLLAYFFSLYKITTKGS